MTIARRKQLCLDVTPYYHCITRCVRRAFLCCQDRESRRIYDHRRGWIEKHLLLLSEVFCIDIAGYAIMSNHYHVVLKVDQSQAASLTDEAVISRWRKLYKGPEIMQRFCGGELLDDEQRQIISGIVAQWREHLTNISRFMGHLNQTVARRANKEDDCKGRFWESRFKLQAILDFKALIRSLCYVDLNPVRAKMSKTPEESDYTSVKRRLRYKKSGLIPFREKFSAGVDTEEHTRNELPISFKEYLALRDWTGQQVSPGKRDAIEASTPSIVERLGYSKEQWIKIQSPVVSWTQKAVGHAETIKDYCVAMGQRWIWQCDR